MTNPRRVSGDLHTVLAGADVFIGVSAPGVLKPEWIQDMAPDAVVFALANPDPEVDPAEADKYAAVVASGRSDYPNQINNVLAFPGVFRGLLDARASAGHHRHAAARRRGDRARGQGRRAQPELHHPVRLPPRRAEGGRCRGRGERLRGFRAVAQPRPHPPRPPEPVAEQHGDRRAPAWCARPGCRAARRRR